MSTMVERVARAICAQAGGNPDHVVDPAGSCLWTLYTDDARVAIDAMREPTERMFMVGSNVPVSNRGQDHKGLARRGVRIGDMAAADAWRKMIDAALAEGAQ